MEASYGQARQSLTIHFADIDGAIVQGQVSDADSGKPLQNVQLRTDSGLTAATDAEGHFIITTGSELKDFGETTLHISVGGFCLGVSSRSLRPYYPNKRKIHIQPNQATVVDVGLHPIADGVFASTVIVLDSQTDTPETQELITTLEGMLQLAGAKVYNIHVPLG